MAQENPQTAGMATNGPTDGNVMFPHSGIPASSVQLTIRLLMQSRDVGSIIGKGGATISKFRNESHAHINITDGGTERIVTLTGTTDAIFAAFSMICKKVEEGFRQSTSSSGQQPPVSLRLLIPASQCGPLIGKSGSKIKELREATGTTVQVAGELLPNSTERAVTISGTSDALSQCLYRIACVMLENPVRGPTIPYRPRQTNSVPAATPPFLGFPPTFTLNDPFALGVQPPVLQMKPLASDYVSADPLLYNSAGPMTTAGHPTNFDMCIPNELVGCVIGRGGHKISEIRRQSGASIKIGNIVANCPDRRITVTGTTECVTAAQHLISARLQAELANKHVTHPDVMSTMILPHNVNGVGGSNGMHMLPKQDHHILPSMQPMHTPSGLPLAAGPDNGQSVQA
ncbi:poly(rC)-binding protein 3-like [Sycon ciliatum]|uniref:poly(rC)-binding protein 3-like n=1 Tax=Sycon ciliatum TaxID=27933 RepID=UPI0020AD33DC|eukprot:scpid74923/ scgid28526/ Poly(rC)-binding protein 3; Alpha-CP3